MNNNEIIQRLVEVVEGREPRTRHADLYILARYLYRSGDPLLTDAAYEELQSTLQSINYPGLQEYFDRSYDDDPVPYDLLEEFQLEIAKPLIDKSREELVPILDEDKSLSIASVTNYRDAYQFMMEKRALGLDVMTSLKMDGINTKTLFVDGSFVLGMSRGRSGSGFDFTDNLRHTFPHTIETSIPELKITGESFVEKKGLPILREKYNQDGYKTSKSAAISLLRVAHAKEDYNYLHTKVFAVEGLAETLDETFSILRNNGFDVVPHKLIHWEDIPADFNAFEVWLKEEVFDYLKHEQDKETMPADGVVLEVNDLNWAGVQKNQYSNRQLACKFEYWAFDYYRSKIVDIIYSQRRVTGSLRVEIEPVVTNDDCTATFINVFNPSILILNNLKVGSDIYFERNSGAVNILLYGDKLKKKLEG